MRYALSTVALYAFRTAYVYRPAVRVRVLGLPAHEAGFKVALLRSNSVKAETSLQKRSLEDDPQLEK